MRLVSNQHQDQSQQLRERLGPKAQLLAHLFSRPSYTRATEKNSATSVHFLGSDPGRLRPRLGVHAEVRIPEKSLVSSKRAVLILPTFYGLTFLDRWLVRSIEQAGYCVASILRFSGDHDIDAHWDVHQRGLLRGATSIHWMLDWLRELGFQEFSLFGASMGALHAGVSACVERDVVRTVLVAGGAPIWEIAADSEEAHVREMKSMREQREHIVTLNEYRAKLKRSFTLDLADLAQPRPGREDFLILGQRDSSVPSLTQRKLAEALKPSRIVSLPLGHLGTIAAAQTFYRRQILKHLLY